MAAVHCGLAGDDYRRGYGRGQSTHKPAKAAILPKNGRYWLQSSVFWWSRGGLAGINHVDCGKYTISQFGTTIALYKSVRGVFSQHHSVQSEARCKRSARMFGIRELDAPNEVRHPPSRFPQNGTFMEAVTGRCELRAIFRGGEVACRL